MRVREFMMAEIEHFCDPDDKTHPKFSQVSVNFSKKKKRKKLLQHKAGDVTGTFQLIPWNS